MFTSLLPLLRGADLSVHMHLESAEGPSPKIRVSVIPIRPDGSTKDPSLFTPITLVSTAAELDEKFPHLVGGYASSLLSLDEQFEATMQQIKMQADAARKTALDKSKQVTKTTPNKPATPALTSKAGAKADEPIESAAQISGIPQKPETTVPEAKAPAINQKPPAKTAKKGGAAPKTAAGHEASAAEADPVVTEPPPASLPVTSEQERAKTLEASSIEAESKAASPISQASQMDDLAAALEALDPHPDGEAGAPSEMSSTSTAEADKGEAADSDAGGPGMYARLADPEYYRSYSLPELRDLIGKLLPNQAAKARQTKTIARELAGAFEKLDRGQPGLSRKEVAAMEKWADQALHPEPVVA